jgi:plasmid stabilization system protein ParE
VNRYEVELSPEALGQARRIRAWLEENRGSADVFLDELGALIERLEVLPFIGAPYHESGVEGMRRVLLKKSRHHVYYAHLEARRTSLIHAIWHTSRGGSPFV